MNKLLYSILLLYCLTACETGVPDAGEPFARRPNVVLIFTDDHTYTAVRALGNTEIYTPNIDRIVENGTTFTHAYNMGGWNGAICVASRAMIISGRSVWRARRFSKAWSDGDSSLLAQTWGRLMAARGYDTYMSGKWHVNIPADQVFDQVKHIRPGMPRDTWPEARVGQKLRAAKGQSVRLDEIMPVGYNRPKDENDDSWTPDDPKFGGFWEGGRHWSEVLKDDALDFIHQAARRDNPFFMYLAFNAPHDPRQAPKNFIDQYPVEDIELPESWLPEYPWKDSIGAGYGLRDEALAPFPRTPYATKKHIQEYYAIISHLDEQVGKILDALEQTGMKDSTYVLFTADHGLAVGKHGLLGKQNMYDHSIRVPLMIMGPGVPKGKRIDTDVYLQDVMPTTLELAGMQKPGYVEFNSLLNLIKGRTEQSPYDGIYGAYIDLQRMIRKDGFKLIVYPRIEKVLLYDLENDPEEINNLADNEEYAEEVEMLFTDLIQLQRQMGDQLDLQPLSQQFLQEAED